MDYDKLIEQLNAWNEQHLSVVCGGKHFACDYLCENDDCLIVKAATALSMLQAENAQLRESRDHWKRLAHELSEGVNGKDAEHERLQAENEKLRAELENYRKGHCSEGGCAAEKDRDTVMAELEQVKAERDAAVEAVKNMAEYIVCAGRVDYFLCDEISQEHHLKYQPKNDGNYDNEPCYKCVADWFLQGHKWQESE